MASGTSRETASRAAVAPKRLVTSRRAIMGRILRVVGSKLDKRPAAGHNARHMQHGRSIGNLVLT